MKEIMNKGSTKELTKETTKETMKERTEETSFFLNCKCKRNK